MLIELIKIKLFSLTEKVHIRVFGYKMSGEMKKFIGNLGISFFGGVVSSILLLLTSVFAGRFLGPVQYGKYAVYVALFSFFGIFLSFGLETSIVRLAAKADEKKRREVFSTFILFFFINALFWSTLFLFLSNFIEGFFTLPFSLILLAMLFAIVNSLSMAIENYLKLSNHFVFVNAARVVQGVFLLSFVLSLYILFEDLFSLRWFIIINVVASILVLILFLYKTRSYIRLFFDAEVLRELFLFSSIFFLGSVSNYLIQSGTSVLINKFIGARELGFFNAYYTLSALATGQFIIFFSSVYFPAVAKAEDKFSVVKRVKKIFPMLGVFWFLLTALIMFFGLHLYGKEYHIDYIAILLFSLYALFNLYGSLIGFITISGGNQKIVRGLFTAWFFFVVLYFVSLGILGVLGLLTFYSVLIGYVIIFLINAVLNKYFCNLYLSKL